MVTTLGLFDASSLLAQQPLLLSGLLKTLLAVRQPPPALIGTEDAHGVARCVYRSPVLSVVWVPQVLQAAAPLPTSPCSPQGPWLTCTLMALQGPRPVLHSAE